MKNIVCFVILLLVVGFTSCTKRGDEVQKWEYKIVSEFGVDRSVFLSKGIPMPEDQLNALGDEGWELVDVYTRVETVHPNFGNEKYVTGLQPNTRTEAVLFVFKRPKREDRGENKAESVVEDEVVVEAVVDSL